MTTFPLLSSIGAPSLTRITRGLAVALLALGFLALARPAAAQSLSATLTITGSPQHTIRTRNGGAEWLMSGYTILETGRLAPGAAVAYKTWNDNFGYRWDTLSHEPTNNTYGWFNRIPGNPRTFPETLDEEMTASEQAGWTAVYCQPTPKSLNATATGKGAGYLWQTHEFYANMAQYISGRADADYQSKVDALPTLDSLDPRNAGFNWANLRAARGHVMPFPIYGFCIGSEPYWVEDLTASEYVTHYLARARAIRSKVPDARLGIFLQNGGDDHWDGQLMGPNRVTPDLVDFLILRDNYHGMGNPRSDNLPFFLGAYNARHASTTGTQYNPDGTMHLWSGYHVPATTNYYAEHARQWVDKNVPTKPDLKKQLIWTEWGYCLSCSPGTMNDLGMAIMRAGQFAEGLKDDVLLNSTWTLNNEPPFDFGILSRRSDSFDFQLSPSHYLLQLLQELLNSRYVPSSLSSPTYEVDPPVQFPRLSINYLDAWVFEKNGARYLVVINRHLSESIRLNLANLPDYGVVSWKQIGGTGFTHLSNNKSNPTNVVIRTRPAGPLVFEPLSISLVQLSQGATAPSDTRIWGDVSHDGVVNSTDALGTLSHTVGLPNGVYDYAVADVNADGTITTLDALVDLYYSVGLDVSGYRVGQPVESGNGDRVAAPQLARAPRPSDAKVYVGLRPPRSGGRREAEVQPGGDLRLLLRAARYAVEEPIAAFHVRLTWDPARLRFRSTGSPTADAQLLLGVNDADVSAGTLVVAGATPGELSEELLAVQFERLAPDAGPTDVTLEVLGLGAARTGEDLTPHVEISSEKVDPEGERGGAGSSEGGLGLPYPNPARGHVSIPVKVDASGAAALAASGAEIELTVYDIRGRRVKQLLSDEPTAGERVVEWDGTDASGRRVPAGIYVVQLRSGESRETRKVVLY